MYKATIVFAVFFVSTTLAAQDRLVFRPDPGMGNSVTPLDLSYPAGSIQVEREGTGIRIRNPVDAPYNWRLFLRPPVDAELAAGCYERARWQSDPVRPEINFSFGSVSCSSIYGRFQILELERAGGAIVKLAVDFNQQCERYGAAMAGQIRFNSTVPISANFPRAVIETSGSLNFEAEFGAVGWRPGGVGSYSLERSTLTPSRNFYNGASFNYFGPQPGGTTDNWTLNFSAAGNVPLTVGSYPSATRFPFSAPNNAGLDFGINGAGCNTLHGNFTVTNILMDGLDGIPLVFDATFDQRCPDATGRLTRGTLSYTGNVIGPTSLPLPDVLLKSSLEDGEVLPGPNAFYSATCD